MTNFFPSLRKQGTFLYVYIIVVNYRWLVPPDFGTLCDLTIHRIVSLLLCSPKNVCRILKAPTMLVNGNIRGFFYVKAIKYL